MNLHSIAYKHPCVYEHKTVVYGYTAWIHAGPCAGSQDHVMTPALQPAAAAVDNMLPS